VFTYRKKRLMNMPVKLVIAGVHIRITAQKKIAADTTFATGNR
jgi:hypothetical protein